MACSMSVVRIALAMTMTVFGCSTGADSASGDPAGAASDRAGAPSGRLGDAGGAASTGATGTEGGPGDAPSSPCTYAVPSIVRQDIDGGTAQGFAKDDAGNLFSAGNVDPGDWRVQRSTDGGSHWTTVDDLPSARSNSIVADAVGNVYVSGTSVATTHVVIRKSADHGATWTNTSSPSVVTRLATDTAGNLYAIDSGGWTVSRSSDQGATWKTLDAFSYQDNGVYAFGVTRDAAGDVFVVGYGYASSGAWHWLVRKSADDGKTWATADDYVGPPSTTDEAAAGAAGVDAVGNLFVAGVAQKRAAAGAPRWIVRKSADKGKTWATVDDTLNADASGKGYLWVTELWSDAFGNIYAAGAGNTGAGWRFGVRRSSDHGATWSKLIDDPQDLPYGQVEAGIDSAGNLFTSRRGSTRPTSTT